MARGVRMTRTRIDSMRICCGSAEFGFGYACRHARRFAALRASCSHTREPRRASGCTYLIRKSASTWRPGTGMPSPHSRTWLTTITHPEEGIALPTVLMAMTLLMALSGGLLMVVMTEARIAAHYRDGLEAFHAADALVEQIRSELRQVSGVSAVLTGEF